MIRILITAIILLFIPCLDYNEKGISIDPFGVDMNKVMYYNPDSGKVVILWYCKLEQGAPPEIPSQCECIGTGSSFGNKSNVVIFFGCYNSTKRLLPSEKVIDILEFKKCECFKKFKGEILNFLKQQPNERGFQKALFPLFNNLLGLLYKLFALL